MADAFGDEHSSAASPRITPPAASGAAYLIPISGPPLETIVLAPLGHAQTLGREEGCDISLPAHAAKVSRAHARFRIDSARWHVADANSRWGTFLNGIKLFPGEEIPLSE